MILEKRKLFLKTIQLMLEDDKIAAAVGSGRYSKITVTSYDELNMFNFERLSKTTALVDLTIPENDIFRHFNDTTRNEISKTYKIQGLRFVKDEEIFTDCYALYSDFEYKQGRVPVAMADLQKCEFFGAHYNKEIISGISVMKAPGRLRIRSIFSKRLATNDNELYKIISYATRRIVWEICRWGKKNGYVSLDMASVNFNNPKTANITKFKMSFGGSVVNEYTYIYKSPIFLFFERLTGIKLFFLKMFHRVFGPIRRK